MSIIYTLFHDKNKNEPVRQFSYLNEDDFKMYNDVGYGVYFTVNEFNNRRTKENITKLKHCYCDVDMAKDGDGSTREQIEERKAVIAEALVAYCEPTTMIDTSNGLQPLWEITDGEPSEENIERYVNVLKGIRDWTIEHGSAGDNVYDVSRVVRLPGYNHMKAEPYMCKVIHKSEKKYVLSELEQMFPHKEVEAEWQPQPETKDTIFQEIDNIDFAELITRAFALIGRPITFDSMGRMIDPVGETTGTFIGRKNNRDYLASTSHDPFVGNRITATASILKISNSEAYKWICSQYGIGKKAEPERPEIVVKKKKRDDDARFSWGTKNLNNSFAVIEQGSLIVVAAPSGAGKTTYTFFMATANARMGNKTQYISLEVDAENFVKGISRKRAGITPEEKFNFNISDNKQAIYEERIKEINSIKNLELSSLRGSNGTTRVKDIEEIIAKSNPDIVFIDNLDMIAPEKGEDEMLRQNNIISSLLSFSQRTGIVIVLVHHFRKKSQGSKSQGLDEMRGSGKIRDGADLIITITRNQDPEAEYPEKYRTTISLDKGRSWDECARDIYFIRGDFVDVPPKQAAYEGKSEEAMMINNLLND